jgi:hypothetical protein
MLPGDSTSTTESPGEEAQAMWCLVIFPNNNTGTDNPSLKPNLACERKPQSLSSVRVRKARRITRSTSLKSAVSVASASPKAGRSFGKTARLMLSKLGGRDPTTFLKERQHVNAV